MKKRHRDAEHDNGERWLLTYADLITLLLGLFVILYAISKVDAGKYAEIVAALGGVFGGEKPSVVQGQGGVLPSAFMSTERQKIKTEIRAALDTEAKKGLISISENERGLTVHIMEELLFASGNADLKQSSLNTLDALAGVLKELPNDVRVEGHTDDVPISTGTFPSNWHLSVGRAVNVGYYLIVKHELVAEKVSVVGYSEYHPLVPNTSAENRARNRRVDIVVVTNGNHLAAGKPNPDAGKELGNVHSENGAQQAAASPAGGSSKESVQ
jgi:chemotaxis protein MotB